VWHFVLPLCVILLLRGPGREVSCRRNLIRRNRSGFIGCLLHLRCAAGLRACLSIQEASASSAASLPQLKRARSRSHTRSRPLQIQCFSAARNKKLSPQRGLNRVAHVPLADEHTILAKVAAAVGVTTLDLYWYQSTLMQTLNGPMSLIDIFVWIV